MRLECRDCPQLCKQLDDDDLPVHYHFYHLKSAQLIEILQLNLYAFRGRQWRIKSSALSLGNQLAVLLENIPFAENNQVVEQCLIFVAEVGADENCELHKSEACTSHLWVRYSSPLVFCSDQVLMSEITELVNSSLSALIASDQPVRKH